uniref:R13L1/DRL21-like LRR repeat region domain-containing protein n=1 Tax=Oryza punctata TaxID=4537 RepID=A0A0E0LDX9_ORYPU
MASYHFTCNTIKHNAPQVAFFWVKPIEVGMFYTSNISLLYKHLEAQSTVVFQNLENVKRPDEVLELANYQQLRSVCLVWSRSNLTEDSSMDQEKAVLQKLRPHQDLETLRIEGYQGDEFCSWMMNINSFLPNLVIIKLSNINKCQWLPPLGQLANLEVLHISDMPRVEGVNGMNSLKDEHKLPQGDDFFPNLQVLSIVNCPRLRLIPAFPGCRECALVKSGNILVSFEQFSRSSNLALITLEINDCGSSSDIVRFLQSSENLEHLTIDSCIDLITLPEPIRKCRSLKKLEIRNCCNFSELPEWLGELTLLQRIEVQATKLECLPQSIRCLTALKLLVLNQCNYKLRAWCQSEKNKGKIKHIERVDMNETDSRMRAKVPVLNIHSQRDVMYFRSVTSDHLIELKIGGLNDETDPKEVEKIELREKTDLCSLSLHWDNGTRMHNKTIFEKLLPHDGLEILRIRNYAGVDFPSWMSSLPTLVKLDMDDTRFEHLHLDRLQNLTELHLSKVKCGHLHLDQLQNITKMELSGVEFKQLHLDRLQNLTELHLSEVKCGHLHLDQLQNVTELKLHGQFQRLHFDHLLGLRHLYLSRLQFEHVLLNQLQSLEELHLSQIESLGSNQPACIECTQPLGKLQKILMSEVENQELKIFMQGGEGDENLFPGLQYLKMELCENLRFQPSIPRSTRYTISGKLNRPLSNLASFRRVTGLPTPGSTCTMEIVYTKGLSSQTCELQHLELLDITELTIDYCTDLCPLPKCILGWKTSLRKLEILRCKSIDSLPEWLGEMTSLSELIIETYFMETLHPCIQRLTNLQTLKLSKCFDDKFIERCRESGDDWINIMHIPNIQITGVTGRTEIIAPRCT